MNNSDSQPLVPGDSTIASSKKKGRGVAKPNKNWGTVGYKLILEWNEFFQPVGDNAKILAGQLGSFARDANLLPLTLTSWDGQDPHVLENIWQDVMANTNAPCGYRKTCLDTIGERWRQAKHQVKDRYYKTCETYEERLNNRPEHIEPEEWKTLIKYWDKESTKATAEVNAQCRARLVAVYRKGRTSMANLRYEMGKKDEPTDRFSIWKKSRLKKDGTFDEKDGAKELEGLMTSKLDNLTPEERQDESIVDQVFVNIVGDDGHGRVRCMGIGAPSLSMTKAKQSTEYVLEEKVKNLEGELEAQKMETIRMKNESDRMKKQFDQMMKMLQNQGFSVPVSDSQNSEHTHDLSVGQENENEMENGTQEDTSRDDIRK